ncbi:hypothetical protein PTI98_013015 [Pleurotus ostreatus]|nr:hypothetical protein PTI98_013015 [Pleurotus ostreatus]
MHGTLISLVLALSLSVSGTPQQPSTKVANGSTAKCDPYEEDLVEANLSSFPPIWEKATIVDGDKDAQATFSALKGKIPNISIKGGGASNISEALKTYPDSDPDCWWSFNQCTDAKYPGVPDDISFVPEPKTLGYGFDDGPNCAHNTFYDYLASQKQLATMYFVGSNVIDWPREARRAVSDGHEICLHGWSHKYMTTLSNEEAFAELYYGVLAVCYHTSVILTGNFSFQFITGVTPTCWRPPFGDTDDRIRFIAQSLDLVTILWQYDTFDWKGGQGDAQDDAEVNKNYADIVSLAENGAFDSVGAIVLMHELSTFTMSKAVEYYPDFKRVFDHILPVGAAVNTTSSNDFKRSIPYQYTWTGVGGPYDPYYGMSGYPNSGVSLRTSRQDIADVLWVMCVGFSVLLLIFRVV